MASLEFTCGRFPFGASLLTDAPGHAEEADTPLAAALRDHLAARDVDMDFLPDTGWTLVGVDVTGAEFVTVGGDIGMKIISLESDATGWKVAGWGDCRPNLVLPTGIGVADWSWGDSEPPSPKTQAFTALVHERACASGRSPDGRIVGPLVLPSADAILVIFGVRSEGGVQTCPSNPSLRVPVDLGRPLGERQLLDAGHLPYGDPLAPRP